MSQCKCVIVELFDSVYRTHSIMSLTQYCIVESRDDDGVDKETVSNIVLKYLLGCIKERITGG